MERWQENRSMHTMNLRSVFTAEQQRILERYYENGMTNQSKNCFQLILQCAQDTKLDFSVVRTWVGNKRRKLASKTDQNGVARQSLSKNHALPADAWAPVLAGEIVGTESNPPVTHLLPPQASCSSSSSSPLSSSPLSTGSGPNSDIILTGIYSLTRSTNRFDAPTLSRTGKQTLPLHTTIDRPAQGCTALHTDSAVHHAISARMQRKVPVSTSTPKCIRLFKQITTTDGISPNRAKQHKTLESQTWPQSLPRQTVALRCSPPQSTTDNSTPIQKVFTLAGSGAASHLPFSKTSQDKETIKKQMPDMSAIFSIAMETGDADDEYLREEELANMGPQIQLSKANSGSVCQADGVRSSGVLTQSTTIVNESDNSLFEDKGYHTNSSLTDTSSHSSFSLRPRSQTSSGTPSFKVTRNISAPWLHTNSRKRTLQDRTQFSDKDVYALKRYWDNGMTSLGLVCKEKISAAANKLNVDSEIIKTWIGNRRRKYRLMGIEIPPPKGGPAMFSNQTEAYSPQNLEDEDEIPKLAEGCEDNGIVSLCLSDDGASDCYETINDYVNDESDRSSAGGNVIEITDEEDNGDILNAEMEQLQTFLEFKNEEVQFLEEELHNQKRKFSKLQSFTRTLLIAVKNNDQKKQEDLFASLRHKEELGLCMDNHIEFGIEATSTQKDSSMSEEYNTGPVRL
ncbi:highly divergent homeobox isoform X2 [Triplophysa dalaica]|uniref:highly divergent homeobox isoform X2 n=1 Tax=Triplophysa dalaica TaxID=1582913 RepID=UPI0024DFDB71|nr:highly divergent homeobox isoform X2 [Triplophysa dalaica]